MRRLRDDAGHSRIHGLSPQARTFAHAGRCGGSLSTSSGLQELSHFSQRPSLHRLLSKPTCSAELAVRIGHPHLKLDRETEALLYWASSSTATPLWNLSPDAAREEYRRTLAKTEIKPPGIDETS